MTPGRTLPGRCSTHSWGYESFVTPSRFAVDRIAGQVYNKLSFKATVHLEVLAMYTM